MHSRSNVVSVENRLLTTSIAACVTALDEEIAIVRKGGGQKSYLSDGRHLGMRDGRAVYSFTSDGELRFPDDSAIDLEYRQSRHGGIIVSIAGLDVIIALEDYIGTSIATAILYTEPWFLLQHLQTRLVAMNSLPATNRRLASDLISEGNTTYEPDERLALKLLQPARFHRAKAFACNAAQRRAIGHVLANPISFIWGPPGTGKTSTLGMTVAALVESGASVLVLAHSNVAVDVAMKGIAASLSYHSAYAEGRVIRFGSPALDDLDTYPQLHVRGVVRQQNPELITQIEEWEQQRRQLVNRSRADGLSAIENQRIKDDIARIKIVLAPLQAQLKIKESELVSHATVVGCTFSKATIAKEIADRQFDAVVIDEASMAYIPHCIFAAGLSRQRVAIFGDFRQLAPIAQAETELVQRWLLRDIFDQSGITARVNAGQSDPRMVMLTTQHRMHPSIADIINRLFYGGRLRDGANVISQAETAVVAQPGSGHALVFFDLYHLTAHCFSDKESHSRFNPVSALVAAQLAQQTLQNGIQTVGIVTPYSAQARLIRRILKDLKLPEDRVRVATVHRFQGSENQTIIFDAVDGEPQNKPGKLLQGGMGSTAMRLANVAISRAQGKFIGLFNRSYLASHLGYTDIFLTFMQDLAARASIQSMSWPHRRSRTTFGTGITSLQVYAGSLEAAARIEQDLLTAREEIAIYWPAPLASGHVFSSVLPRCDSTRVRFSISGRGARSFPIGLRNAQVFDRASDLGVGLIGLDRKRLWLVLDPTMPTSPVLRLDMPYTSALLYALWRLVPETDLKPGQALRMLCPQCKESLWMATGKYGAYMKCIGGCGYTRTITPAVAADIAQLSSIVCGSCGAMVKGRRGSNGVFLGCSRYPTCTWTMPVEALV